MAPGDRGEGETAGGDEADAGRAAATVLTEVRDRVARITLNRPAQRNALDDRAAAGIAAALRAAQADPAVRAIVLTGAGDRAFCAGGDLKVDASGSPFEVDPARPDNPILGLFRTFEQTTKPTLARVNGHALAGGLGLMCACDLAIAVDTATFGVPETGIGLFPMMILPYLQRAMPRRRLLEWCITGERWSAAEAFEAGLLNRIVRPGELDGTIDALLETIVARSPTAIRLGKRGFHAMEDMTLAQAFEYAELALPNMARTPDAKEGFEAFREKRPPVFRGD